VLRGSSASKGLIELTMLILAVVGVVVAVALVVVVSRWCREGRSIDGRGKRRCGRG
jgi:ABC-type Fe3+ transport system permease subunit